MTISPPIETVKGQMEGQLKWSVDGGGWRRSQGSNTYTVTRSQQSRLDPRSSRPEVNVNPGSAIHGPV
jgi:hypothetical protein